MPTNTHTPATVFYNPVTGAAWIARADGTTTPIGDNLPGLRHVAHAMSNAGVIRTGDFLPAYGPVKSCTVWV